MPEAGNRECDCDPRANSARRRIRPPRFDLARNFECAWLSSAGITSSARASSVGGTSMCSSLATGAVPVAVMSTPEQKCIGLPE